MRVDFSQFDAKSRPVLVLKNLDGTALQTLGYAFNVEIELSFNEVSSLTFTLPAQVNGSPTPHYDEVVGMRIVELVGVGQFYLLDPTEESEGARKVKNCKAYSLEYEFAKKNIYLEEGTYNFFDGLNPDNPDTIVGRIREVMPDWTVSADSSVMSDLVGRYRTFDEINKKVYEFMKSDVQEKYGCIFDFDTMTRTIYITSATAANNDVQQVYLSEDNLIKKITVNEDSDGIVTCLNVYGDEGVDIRSVNPTGENKIYNLDYFMTTDNFSQELIDKWHAWEAAVDAQRDNYYNIQMQYNMLLLKILMAENGLNTADRNISTLQNEQAAIIHGIQTKSRTQAQLNAKNTAIATARTSAATERSSVATMKTQAATLLSQMESINASLAMDEYFTEDELILLRRYFIEDTIQDSSFVASSVSSYIDPVTLNVDNVSIVISNSTYSSSGLTGDFKGGSIALRRQNQTNVLSGNIVRAYMQDEAAARFLLSVTMSGGTVGNASFSSGNLVISGTRGTMTTVDNVRTINGVAGNIIFTQDATEYQRHQVERELLEYGESVLEQKASPTYQFSVECANFLNMDKFTAFKNQLNLGKRVYLKLNDTVYEPYVISVHMSYEDPTSCSIAFSDTYTSFDQSFSLAKLLEQSVSMGKSLSYKSGQYSAFVNSGASSEVKEFIESALDISKNKVLSSNSQDITFDDTGIRIRKYKKDGNDEFVLGPNGEKQHEPEEIWMTDSSIMFTDDNWATAKMAIGKVSRPEMKAYKRTTDTSRNTSKKYYVNEYGTEWDENIHGAWSTDLWEVDSSNSGGYGYGIIADYLIGKMIVGQNMIIECPGPDGQTTQFKVDGSGATINNGTFTVTNGSSKIVISPDGGIGIGTSGMEYALDSNTNTMKWNNYTNFYVDTSGNVHFKGDLSGSSGTFGSGNAKVVLGSGGIGVGSNPVYNNGLWTGAQFYVDASGNVYFTGNLTGSTGTFKGVVQASDFKDTAGNSLFQPNSGNSAIAYQHLDMGNSYFDAQGNLHLAGSIYMDGNIQWGSNYPSTNVSRQDFLNCLYTSDGIYNNGGSIYINASFINAGTIDANTVSLGGSYGTVAQYTGTVVNGGVYSDTSGIWMYAPGGGDVAASNAGAHIKYGTSQIWVASGVCGSSSQMSTGSDKRTKHDISYKMDVYDKFFNALAPVSYKYNNGTSNRLHLGFVAQDVEEALIKSGMTTQDFAGIIINDYGKDVDEDDYKGKDYYPHQYSLRYGEFIALNTHMIQKLYKRVESLEAQLAAQK